MDDNSPRSSQAASHSKGSLTTLYLKITGLTAIVSGLFGVGYQKGIILTMNLGNLSGNYEVREIFNSAVLGYLHAFSLFENLEYWPTVLHKLSESYGLLVVLLCIGVIPPLMYRNSLKVKNYLSSISFSRHAIIEKTFSSLILSPIAIISGAYAAILSVLLACYMIPFLVSVFVFPTLVGYVLGENFVAKEMEQKFCVPITQEMKGRQKLRQCTQVSIRGKTITAKIFLETSDAYFMRRNSAFIYVTKNGSNCIYSIYANSEEAIKNDKFKFVDEDIKSFCDSKDGVEWNNKPNSAA
ncbi:hypothetical protein [Thalassotalea euphylliae]|uniref:Uncharacterized protein n=1 Tax=Thalassotalea euphylliae TaxID=1655234 RepID=A0A3E0U3J7_9GAMM|nr:hypothetical protein [Thalassotalea euphylliae]REL31300.1 hypothetical protein DXX94_11580 [Thalassotalea euphylliae]